MIIGLIKHSLVWNIGELFIASRRHGVYEVNGLALLFCMLNHGGHDGELWF